ncbi:MAG: S8 family peptidase [Pseudomonadales bacterium]|nr:S8 family peptidase [Pseudomonadales bacterium]
MNHLKLSLLFVTALLISCGGSGDPDNPTFSTGGTIIGLSGSLSIRNNSEVLLATGSSFTFNDQLAVGSVYNVTIESQPEGQTCTVSNGQGVIQNQNIANVIVNCVDETFEIRGQITGLTESITLQNGNILLTATGSQFTFQGPYSNGQAYNVEINTQPTGQNCTLNNAQGIIQSEDITDIQLICTTINYGSISGMVTAAAFTLVDNDTNEPTTTQGIPNNSVSTAQEIPNYSIVHGFSSFEGTGNQDHIFATQGDDIDVYKVHLQKDQIIALQVVDFDFTGSYQGDLDLYLWDMDLNLIVYSNTVTEFEAIQVPSDGDYYIEVSAFSGISKYVLLLEHVGVNYTGTPSTQADFVTNQSIVKFKPFTNVSAFSKKDSGFIASTSNTSSNRTTLVTFDSLSLGSPLSLGSYSTSSSSGSYPNLTDNKFIQEVASTNARSYQKFKTLLAIKKLSQQDDVEYAEPNYIVQAMATPNDTHYAVQWHYQNMKLEQAWDITTGTPAQGDDVIVAVIDTGVFLAHEDLQGQLISGYDFISTPSMSNDGDGIDANPDDPGDSTENGKSSWHGTHVAGTVASRTDNNLGLAGVSWGAKIMPLRVLGVEGGTSNDIIQSVRYAAGLSNDSGTIPAKRADIINLSLGGGSFLQSAQEAYTAARNEGVIIIAAAGNENTSQLSYPASYEGVVSVSATDYNNERAPYSNFGTAIDVAAPGGDTSADLNQDRYSDGVWSCLVDDSSGTRQSAYVAYQGTSMAAPHMAGIVALMKAVHTDLSPNDFDLLLSSGTITTDLGLVGRDDTYGHGFIDAFKAVQEASRLAGGGQLPSVLSTSLSAVNFGSSGTTKEFDLINSGEASGLVSLTPPSESWFSVTAQTVDSDNLGTYLVTIDRNGLQDGYYSERIRFTSAAGSAVEVVISTNVGTVSSSGDLGVTWVLLLDSNYDFVGQTTTTPVGNGVHSYQIENVPPGSYYLLGGSDIDYDDIICQAGESCGAYPLVDQVSVIEKNTEELTSIDFTLELGFGISNNSASSQLKFISGISNTIGVTQKKSSFSKPNKTIEINLDN